MICSKCNQDKPEEEFCFKDKSLNKRHTVCKVCQREYKLKYYYSNKESHYKRNQKTNDKIADFIDDYKRKHPCIVCGETAVECLDFHHLKDKDIEVSKLRRKGSINRLITEISKCIVLCANCHRKVHAGTLNINTLV